MYSSTLFTNIVSQSCNLSHLVSCLNLLNSRRVHSCAERCHLQWIMKPLRTCQIIGFPPSEIFRFQVQREKERRFLEYVFHHFRLLKDRSAADHALHPRTRIRCNTKMLSTRSRNYYFSSLYKLYEICVWSSITSVRE